MVVVQVNKWQSPTTVIYTHSSTWSLVEDDQKNLFYNNKV